MPVLDFSKTLEMQGSLLNYLNVVPFRVKYMYYQCYSSLDSGLPNVVYFLGTMIVLTNLTYYYMVFLGTCVHS